MSPRSVLIFDLSFSKCSRACKLLQCSKMQHVTVKQYSWTSCKCGIPVPGLA